MVVSLTDVVGDATIVMLAGVVVCTPAEVLTVMGVVPDLVVVIVVVTLAGTAVRAHEGWGDSGGRRSRRRDRPTGGEPAGGVQPALALGLTVVVVVINTWSSPQAACS